MIFFQQRLLVVLVILAISCQTSIRKDLRGKNLRPTRISCNGGQASLALTGAQNFHQQMKAILEQRFPGQVKTEERLPQLAATHPEAKQLNQQIRQLEDRIGAYAALEVQLRAIQDASGSTKQDFNQLPAEAQKIAQEADRAEKDLIRELEELKFPAPNVAKNKEKAGAAGLSKAKTAAGIGVVAGMLIIGGLTIYNYPLSQSELEEDSGLELSSCAEE